MRRLTVAFLLAALLAAPAAAQNPAPNAIEVPGWFTETFLDIREDARDAARDGKRLLVYFHQDGCPYCAELMRVNFRQRGIVEKTRKHFVAIALNIWGDREVTWVDGRVLREKDLTRALKVQFTPTMIFLDGDGKEVLRLNGYYPPDRFDAALDVASGKAKQTKPAARQANPALNAQPFFTEKLTGKPRAVLYETRSCRECDELHREAFKRKEVLEQIARFDVRRVDATAKDLGIAYVPTLVLMDAAGKEVLRLEAYLRPFHVAGALEYVASGAYRTEPSFQRFLQAKADRIREAGGTVELWK